MEAKSEKSEDYGRSNTYYLSLDKSGNPKKNQDQIFQLEKSSTLHIEILNGSEITNGICLISNAKENFPMTLQEKILSHSNLTKAEFAKFIFEPLELTTSFIYEITLGRTGPIMFFFVYFDKNTNEEKNTTPFYINVLPSINIKDKEIKLQDIQMQTVLSKSLGKIDEFEAFFQEASRLKYNFVHFTPIQQLGPSQSLYCHKDNNKIDDYFFNKEDITEDEKFKLFEEQLDKARNKYYLASIIDIVLNHTSVDSEWIGAHPECGYNLVNSPWLNCSYALDKILTNYSNAFCEGVTIQKCQPYCKNENDLNNIMNEIKKIVSKANLYEYFCIDIPVYKKLLENFYEDYSKEENKDKYKSKVNSFSFKLENDMCDYLYYNCLDCFGESKNGVKIDVDVFGCCIIKFFNINKNEKGKFLEKCEKIMKNVNEKNKNNVKTMLDTSFNSIKEYIRHEFVQLGNKAEKSTHPLIPSYFYAIDGNGDDNNKIFLCDGYILESESSSETSKNFVQKGTYYLFKRRVGIWSDCIKLNYGNSPSDCPYLMERMTKYVVSMAKLFDGFNLQSCESIPLRVLQCLMQKAREANSDLLIMAKPMTNVEKEVELVTEVGINLLVKELLWANNAKDLSDQLYNFGKDNSLKDSEQEKYDYYKGELPNVKGMKILSPTSTNSIIFDLTHDNDTYHQKYNNLALNLTTMSCNSFTSTAIGSTRGFDQLFPIQPSVVNEHRKYAYDNQFAELVNKVEPKQAKFPKKKPKKKDSGTKIRKGLESKKSKESLGPKEVLTKFEIKYHAEKVFLALSCRNWKPDVELKKTSGVYRCEVLLPTNQKIYYKYVINGKKWVCDNSKPKEADKQGNVNNFIEIKTEPPVDENKEKRKSNASSSKQSSKELKQVNQHPKEYDVNDLKILRRNLNKIRTELWHYQTEFSMYQDNQFICMFRTLIPDEEYFIKKPNYDGYVLICRTGYDKGYSTPTRVELPGMYSDFVFASSMGVGKVDIEEFKKRDVLYGTDSNVYFTRDGSYMNGLSQIKQENGKSVIYFNKYVQPNTAIVLKYKFDKTRNVFTNLKTSLQKMIDEWPALTKDVDICDINLVLYKCEKEELDNTKGERGTYSFENYGPLCYAGISHLHKMLNEFKITHEEHPIVENIKSGDWLFKYIVDRIKNEDNLKKIYDILVTIYDNYVQLNPSKKLKYFTKIIDTLYNIMIIKLFDIMKNKDMINFSELGRKLLIALPEYIGSVESSRFKHNIDLPFNHLSLCAGIPHFCTEFFRCWGRDTFISFKGVFLIPGMFQEAKAVLITFASVVRHGLIPNLLDSGNNCRYNSRDATWFFLKSVIDYVEMSRDYDFFNTPVNMVFLSDDMNEHFEKLKNGEKKILKMSEIVQNIIQKHVNGIAFREWRAGHEIDSEMTDEGFNVNIYLNMQNGFIYGGTKFNCGTWMDKMGTSNKAKNKGHPATPRNGADIEIISLIYFILTHLDQLYKDGNYPFNSVNLPSNKNMKFADWADKIKANFEQFFYVDKKNDDCLHDNTYRDYISDDNDLRHECQLRPNVFIALAISPSLFKKIHANKFMKLAEEFLVVNNCIGIRTLDSTDKEYNGVYDINNDSEDYNIAQGFNYHNGPEWVWLSGYYLMAKLIFNNYETKEELVSDICKKLAPFEKYISNDIWSGLPELTNKDGKYCEGSCKSQTWSVATLIEALYNLFKIIINPHFQAKGHSISQIRKSSKKKEERGTSVDRIKKKKKIKKLKTDRTEDEATHKKKRRNKTQIKNEKLSESENVNIPIGNSAVVNISCNLQDKINDNNENLNQIITSSTVINNNNDINNSNQLLMPPEVIAQQAALEKVQSQTQEMEKYDEVLNKENEMDNLMRMEEREGDSLLKIGDKSKQKHEKIKTKTFKEDAKKPKLMESNTSNTESIITSSLPLEKPNEDSKNLVQNQSVEQSSQEVTLTQEVKVEQDNNDTQKEMSKDVSHESLPQTDTLKEMSKDVSQESLPQTDTQKEVGQASHENHEQYIVGPDEKKEANVVELNMDDEGEGEEIINTNVEEKKNNEANL